MFKEIKQFEGYYSIDENGIIKSLDRFVNHPKGGFALKKGKIINPVTNGKTGYKMVTLFKNNKGYTFLIHRLVAMMFPEICGEWFNGCVVDHINTVRTDNRAINLKVCTTKENVNNKLTIKKLSTSLKGKSHTAWNKGLKMNNFCGEQHPKSKPVVQYTKDGVIIAEYCSIAEASNKTAIKRNCIDNCLANKSKSAGGFKWKYKNGN